MARQHTSDPFTTPEWVKDAVFYQIFPERFANGDQRTDPENVQPWGTPPTPSNFMGGDLAGITERLDYLAELGITALYLNPIFHASSNHKYNTYDYFAIDPHFGDLAAFHRLIEQAHARDMRVILDGVFNHCGRGFFAFHNLLESGEASPYRHWFHVERFPLHPYNESKPANYYSWWNIRSLPKFNTDHPPTRRYLLDIARYWIEQGADGWRLDVPNEIADHAFWREFRQVVKQANPQAYIVGEIWLDATPWLDGTQFDAVMNYLLRDLCRDFLAYETLSVEEFASGIEELLGRYPPAATAAQFNLLGSHDTARFRTECNGDADKLALATFFMLTMPGAPSIYYGDEIGMQGGDDPECRACFPWERSAWDLALHSQVQRSIALRHQHPALRRGDFQTVLAQNDSPVYAFARWNDDERLIVALNPTDQAMQVMIPLGTLPFAQQTQHARDLLGDASYPVQQGVIQQVELTARSGTVLLLA
jgi:neopullulanase